MKVIGFYSEFAGRINYQATIETCLLITVQIRIPFHFHKQLDIEHIFYTVGKI